MDRPVALVVDPDAGIRKTIREACEARKLTALETADGAGMVQLLENRTVDILFIDPGAPGVEFPTLLREVSLIVAMIPGGDGGRATQLVEEGAYDVLPKPIETTCAARAVARAARQHAVLRDLRRLRFELQQREGYRGFVGHSPQIERLRERLRRVAAGSGPVCVSGETGVGKELAARTLHELAGEGNRPFVAIRCGTLNEHNWELEWFGGDGAGQSAAGLLAQARSGTIYLEELPDLSPELQARLLRTLGLNEPVERPDVAREVRVIASSVREPARAVEDGRWAAESARVLAAETLVLPPLREREGDVALLARHFISTICEINHLPEIRLSPEALALLERYHWPANVQGVRNAMEQAVILAQDGSIRPEDLPERIQAAASAGAAPAVGRSASALRFRKAKREVVEGFERVYLRELMQRHAGNVTAASQQAGMLRSALQRLLRKYDIKSADFRHTRRVQHVQVGRARVE